MPRPNSVMVLRNALAEANEDKSVANIPWLLGLLDLVVEELPLEKQLIVGGEAIAELAEIHFSRSWLAMEEWQNYEQHKVLSIAEGLFAGLLHTSTNLSIDDLVESRLGNDYPAIFQVGIEPLSPAEEIEISREIESKSHDEDISQWVEIIRNYLHGVSKKRVSLRDLVRDTQLNLAAVFLGLLHGGFVIQQSKFYDLDSLVVLVR